MWSLTAGLGALVSALHERLRTPPLVGVAVRRLERTETGWRIHGEADHWDADAVVLTCPAYEQATLLADLDIELAERIGGIAYNRVAVVALGYRASDMPMSLDGFGYLSPQRERHDVLGVQWCSSIFPGQRANASTTTWPPCEPCAAAGIAATWSIGTTTAWCVPCAASMSLRICTLARASRARRRDRPRPAAGSSGGC